MELVPLLTEFGLPGLIIAALIYERSRLVKRNDDLVERLFKQSQDHAAQMIENTRTLEKAAEALKAHA